MYTCGNYVAGVFWGATRLSSETYTASTQKRCRCFTARFRKDSHTFKDERGRTNYYNTTSQVYASYVYVQCLERSYSTPHPHLVTAAKYSPVKETALSAALSRSLQWTFTCSDSCSRGADYSTDSLRCWLKGALWSSGE